MVIFSVGDTDSQTARGGQARWAHLDHIPENKRLTTKAARVGAQLFLFGFDDAVEIRHRQLVLRYHQVRRTVDLHLPAMAMN